MRFFEIICEDISTTEAKRNIVDILTTELPGVLTRLAHISDKFATNYTPKKEQGRYSFNPVSYSKSLNFVIGGQSRARTSLYSLAKSLPPHVGKLLMQFLVDDSNNKFSRIDQGLLPILANAASATSDRVLANAVASAKSAFQGFHSAMERSLDKATELNSDDDVVPVKSTPQPNGHAASIGSQNASVEAIVNDVLSRVNKQSAGEIRNAISKSTNKLMALQQELIKRGITP